MTLNMGRMNDSDPIGDHSEVQMANDLMIPGERIEKAILLVRGQKIMLDRDLAQLYGKQPPNPC